MGRILKDFARRARVIERIMRSLENSDIPEDDWPGIKEVAGVSHR
jgi:hypothetical protein